MLLLLAVPINSVKSVLYMRAHGDILQSVDFQPQPPCNAAPSSPRNSALFVVHQTAAQEQIYLVHTLTISTAVAPSTDP